MEFFRIRRTIPFMHYSLYLNIASIIMFCLAVFFLATKGLPSRLSSRAARTLK